MSSAQRRPPRATVIDVAERAGVSRQTVTRAIHDMPGISTATRAKVLAAADALNYRPSRSGRALVGHETPTLSLLVDDLTNPFFPALATAVVREATAHGWNVVVAETEYAPDPGKLTEELARRADALVGYGVPKQVDETLPGRLPCVHLDMTPGIDPVGVAFEIRGALGRLGRRFAEAGARRVAVLDRSGQRGRFPSRRATLVAEELTAQGCAVRIVEGADLDVAVALGSALGPDPARPDVDAVVAWNDMDALAVLKELHRRRIAVPGSIRVAGVDGLGIGTFVTPELTTIGVDLGEVARHAVELVDGIYTGRLPGSGPAAVRTVDYRLLARESA